VIGFVAFISPHIARRLSRTWSAAAFPASMGVGALMVLHADYTAKRIIEPIELPIGITTILIGAPYLLFLLHKTERATGVA
jgi:iron complex transport system permease protein